MPDQFPRPRVYDLMLTGLKMSHSIERRFLEILFLAETSKAHRIACTCEESQIRTP